MNAYLKVASDVIASGVLNYKGYRVPLTSTFDLQYIKDNIGDYHDKALLDYLTFGFPLGIDNKFSIRNNASDHHASARAFYQYIQSEVKLEPLAGPFPQPPHEHFTWSPLITRPKETGRQVILDLSFRDFSVNKATCTEHYDHTSFTLKLPHLDAMIPQLEQLGNEARLFKVDISRAFRNVCIDPGDALHLGIKWDKGFYLYRNLAVGAVHGTAIFQRIMYFIWFLMAKKGFVIFNYIDDMYACCHVDRADEAFQTLLKITTRIGLPINEKKVFDPTKTLTIVGIVIDVGKRTFSIPQERLHKNYNLCSLMLLKVQITKRDLQSLLGKLLYVARCIQGAHLFLKRMLQTMRQANSSNVITPDIGFYQDLAWFTCFLHSFNGVVSFRRDPVSIHGYVDATLTDLGGAWGDRVYAVKIPLDLGDSLSITHYEMFNITVTLKLWGNNWKDKVVCVHCDNQGR